MFYRYCIFKQKTIVSALFSAYIYKNNYGYVRFQVSPGKVEDAPAEPGGETDPEKCSQRHGVSFVPVSDFLFHTEVMELPPSIIEYKNNWNKKGNLKSRNDNSKTKKY